MGTSDEDSLFELPLEAFTAARNDLAGRLKKAGRADDAERIKGLAKPSVSAWVVNQLYWKHRKPFERLLAGGDRLRKAQAAQLAGRHADLRAPLEERRKSLDELVGLAKVLLDQSGHAPTPETLRRVTTSLEALAAYGSGGPAAGRLSDDVNPPGFEALASLVPQAGRGRANGATPRIIPFQQRSSRTKDTRRRVADEDPRAREAERNAALKLASKAVAHAERTLREARQSAERAQAALKKGAAEARRTDAEKAEAERRMEQAQAAADKVRAAARKLASEAEGAAQAVDDAERALDAAKQILSDLRAT